MKANDHRGREVTILWPAKATAVVAEREHPELTEVWKEIRADALATRPWEVHGRRVALGCAPFTIIVFAAMVIITRDSRMLVMAAVFVALVGASIWSSRRAGLARPEEVIEGMIRRARCPSCAYSIADAPVEPDGCVACPECGAAWRSQATRPKNE